MDLNSFRELLKSFYSEGSEERQEAEEKIYSLSQENLPILLNFLIQILLVDDLISKKRSSALLYAQCRRNSLFLTSENLISFWPIFFDIFKQIILTKEIEEITKSLLVNTASEIVSFFLRENEDSSDICNSLILIIQENENSIPYIIQCISDILFNVPQNNGFNIDDLITLIQCENASLLSRFNLLLATLIHDNENQILHDFFLPMLSSIDINNELQIVFKYLSDFVELFPLFFKQHIEELATFLENILDESKPQETRMQCILFISTLTNYAADICRSNENFCTIVISKLIQTMAEIGDEIEWENDDLNDKSPHKVAIDQFYFITENLNSDFLFQLIMKIYQEQLQSDNWKNIYSAIIAIASTSSITLSLIIQDEDNDLSKQNLIEFMEPILILLDTEGLHPRLRFSCYQLINTFCQVMPLLFPSALFDELVPRLQQYVTTEENDLIRLASVDSLLNFIKYSGTDHLQSIYPEMLETLLSFISECPDDTREKFLICLGSYAMGVGDLFSEHVIEVCSILTDLYQQCESGYSHIKFTIIFTFSLCIRFTQLPEDLIPIATSFFEDLWQMRDLLYTDEDIDNFRFSIVILIESLNLNIAPYAEEILGTALQDINQDIDATIIRHNDKDIDLSFKKRIPSHIEGSKVYVDESRIKEISGNIDLISAIIKALGNECVPLFSTIYESIINFLNSQYFLEVPFTFALQVLSQMINISNDSEFFSSFMTFLLEYFQIIIQSIAFTPSFIKDFLSIVIECLQKIQGSDLISVENHQNFLILTTNLMFHLFSQLLNNLNGKQQFSDDSLSETKLISSYKQCLSNFPILYHSLIQINKEQSFNYFCSQLEQKLIENFTQEIIMKTVIEIWFVFVSEMQDSERLSSIGESVFQWIGSSDDDFRQSLFISLHNAFKSTYLSPESCITYYQFLMQLIQSESLMINSTVNDCALGALSALVKTNFPLLEDEDGSIFDILLESLPIEDIEDISESVYSLFLDELEKNFQETLQEHFSNIISILIRIKESKVISNDLNARALFIFKKIMQCGFGPRLKEEYQILNPIHQKSIRQILRSFLK